MPYYLMCSSFSGTTLGSKAYAPSSVMSGGGFTLVGGGAIAGQGLGLHHANKFNTISNIHKRGDRGECQPVSSALSDLET